MSSNAISGNAGRQTSLAENFGNLFLAYAQDNIETFRGHIYGLPVLDAFTGGTYKA